MIKKIQLAYLLLAIHLISFATPRTPQITIALVIDQLSFSTLEKVKPYLKGGLKFLLHEGITYNNAHVPFACPQTNACHTTLTTGTLPRTHGIVIQQISPEHSLVDGLSDQLTLQTEQHKNYHVFSVALQKDAAVCTAHHMGKAFWVDLQTSVLATDKPYYDNVPTWIRTFNQKNNLLKKPYTWNLHHKCMPQAYAFARSHDYQGSCIMQTLIGKTITHNQDAKDTLSNIMHSPAANELVFDAALACLTEHFCKADCDQKLFFWIIPGALAHLGHITGPNSIEVIDMIYHLDYQLKKFMDAVNKKTRKRNILWCLTSDHAITPLPEQLRAQGYTDAHRIDSTYLIEKLNKIIAHTFDIKHLITTCNNNNLYIDQSVYTSVAKPIRKKIKQMIISILQAEPGIAKVWTFNELEKLPVPCNSVEQRYKNQLYKGKSGKFIICTQPYCMLTPYPCGVHHASAYAYDTQVPLIIYQRAHHQRKKIEDTVFTTQLAPTLAHILQVPKPSACVADILPGIVFKEDCCF